MSVRQILEQVLRSGQSMAREAGGSLPRTGNTGDAGSGGPSNSGLGGLGGLLSGSAGGLGGALSGAGGGLGGLLSGAGGGALGAGAIGMLLGSKKARKMGGKVAMYGGMAALGALAYRAYNDWQHEQSQPMHEPQTLNRVSALEAETHSRAILCAMIGAAKADGHIGDDERAMLETEFGKLGGNAQDQAWLKTELASPLDPATVARHAESPEMAAEMYLASLMMVDEESYMERAYLDELARQLKLPDTLKLQLESRLRVESDG